MKPAFALTIVTPDVSFKKKIIEAHGEAIFPSTRAWVSHSEHKCAVRIALQFRCI